MNRTRKDKRGFTLVEVMVAVSIFSLVMTIGISALLSINTSYVNARAQQSVMDDLNFVLETMSREIRVGQEYYCSRNSTPSESGTADCEDGSMLSFTFQGDRVSYYLSDGVIFQRKDSLRTPMTPESLEINDLTFYVVGSDPTDSKQPTVLIAIQATNTLRGQEETFTFQTTITQRQPDLSS